MLDRIVAAVAMALFSWLEKRLDRPNVSVDLAVDRARLLRAGRRVREWVRREDRVREGRSAGQGEQGARDGSGDAGRPVDRDGGVRSP